MTETNIDDLKLPPPHDEPFLTVRTSHGSTLKVTGHNRALADAVAKVIEGKAIIISRDGVLYDEEAFD